jgi:hypothetical protein
MGLLGWFGNKVESKFMDGCDDELAACRRVISSQPSIQLEIAEGMMKVFQALSSTKYLNPSEPRDYISTVGQIFTTMDSRSRLSLSDKLMKSAVSISKVEPIGGAAVKMVSIWIRLIDTRSEINAARNRADNLINAYEELFVSIIDAALKREKATLD